MSCVHIHAFLFIRTLFIRTLFIKTLFIRTSASDLAKKKHLKNKLSFRFEKKNNIFFQKTGKIRRKTLND